MNAATTRLLTVDDDPVALNLLKEVLSKEGYQVVTALSGEEAIALGMHHAFDIVMKQSGKGLSTM